MTDRLAALRFQLMAGEMAAQIGERIKELREAKGWNQRQLADAMEIPSVTNQTISVYERGINKPSDQRLELVAKALEVDVREFYTPSAETNGATPDLVTTLSDPATDVDDLRELLADALDRLAAMESRLATEFARNEEMRTQIALLVARSEPGASGGS